MCVDSSKRATLEEVLEHKWIKNDIEMKTKVKNMMEAEMKKYESGNKKRSSQEVELKEDNSKEAAILSPKKIKK